MSEPQLKRRISIPKDLSAEARDALANNIIDYIKERTEKSKDIDGNRFAGYSESYSNSLDFKNAGKSKGHVDLRLTEEMMESIEILDSGTGYITIGFQADTPANDKGVWNQRSDNGPSRMFLGVNDKDLERLIAKTEVEYPTTSIAVGIVGNLLKRFGING
jgi:hypothetical protein